MDGPALKKAIEAAPVRRLPGSRSERYERIAVREATVQEVRFFSVQAQAEWRNAWKENGEQPERDLRPDRPGRKRPYRYELTSADGLAFDLIRSQMEDRDVQWGLAPEPKWTIGSPQLLAATSRIEEAVSKSSGAYVLSVETAPENNAKTVAIAIMYDLAAAESERPSGGRTGGSTS